MCSKCILTWSSQACTLLHSFFCQLGHNGSTCSDISNIASLVLSCTEIITTFSHSAFWLVVPPEMNTDSGELSYAGISASSWLQQHWGSVVKLKLEWKRTDHMSWLLAYDAPLLRALEHLQVNLQVSRHDLAPCNDMPEELRLPEM